MRSVKRPRLIARHPSALFLFFCIALFSVSRLRAHEIPNDVTIQAFLKPEGRLLHLLVRVPLVALRDMTWPFKGPDILDTSRATAELTDAATLWVGDEATMYEGTKALPSPRVTAIRATLPTDRSFESYDQALALLTGPPPADTEEISIKEGFMDVLFDYDIESDRSRFSLEPRWARLGIQALTIVRVVLPDGSERRFDLHGDPGLVHLDPTWLQTTRLFFGLGARHFLENAYYLLFVAALVLPFLQRRPLGSILVVFVLAHSATFIAASLGMAPDALWFAPFINTAVAAGTLYLALENIAGTTIHRRPAFGLLFGLALGFSFAFALLQDVQLAGAHTGVSVLAFNAGIESGLLLTLAVMVPVLALLTRRVFPGRLAGIVVSAVIAHAAWHVTAARFSALTQYQFIWPDLTPGFFAALIRWLMVAVSLAGALWLARSVLGPAATGKRPKQTET